MAGVFGLVELKSESGMVALELGVVEVLRDRLLRRFGVGEAAPLSSAPLAASASASFVIRVPSRVSKLSRAALRSPPETVLFRLSFCANGGGVGDGDGS